MRQCYTVPVSTAGGTRAATVTTARQSLQTLVARGQKANTRRFAPAATASTELAIIAVECRGQPRHRVEFPAGVDAKNLRSLQGW